MALKWLICNVMKELREEPIKGVGNLNFQDFDWWYKEIKILKIWGLNLYIYKIQFTNSLHICNISVIKNKFDFLFHFLHSIRTEYQIKISIKLKLIKDLLRIMRGRYSSFITLYTNKCLNEYDLCTYCLFFTLYIQIKQFLSEK